MTETDVQHTGSDMPAAAGAGETLISLAPATGATVASFPVHGAAEVDAAVALARSAAGTWSALSFAERKTAMLRWNAWLSRHDAELLELLHTENGKPAEDALLELILTLEHIHWAACNAGKVLRTRSVSPGLLMSNFAASIEQRPYGVVGVIGPWNYPIYTPNGAIAYALAAGNTVVFKPSEYTPAIGTFLAEAFAKANPGLPRGILEVVTGYGQTGAALCRSAVDKIAFTGSAGTGRKIMAACAENLTPVLMECGGKDAMVVAEDADVPAAAEAAVFGAMSNSGQTCIGVERVYVVDSVREQFLRELRKHLHGLHPGAGADASWGPMTMPSQVDVVRSHVEAAIAGGGQAIVGGVDSVGAPFIEPVVIVDAPEDSIAVRAETFGPTLTVRTVADVDEAVRLANDTEYGLASSVFSANSGMAIARRISAGATAVNSVLSFAAISALPFGGQGESGFGRMHGAEGLREFSRPHSIARQRFAIPGMALLTMRRNKLTVKLVHRLVKLRHARPGVR